MFPDLRLLISATVATFFLAATAGLYASLRITQDQITARTDARSIEDTPVTRIANGWPTPEPSRAAALRDLIRIATYPPIVAREEFVTDRSATRMVPKSGNRFSDKIMRKALCRPTRRHPQPMPTETHSHAALNEAPAHDVTGSTGIATPAEPGSVNQTDHPDIHGNIGDAAAGEQAKSRAAKDAPGGAQEAAAGDGDEERRRAWPSAAGRPAPPPANARRSADHRLPLIFDGPGHQLSRAAARQSRIAPDRVRRCTDDHAAAFRSRSFACDDGDAAARRPCATASISRVTPMRSATRAIGSPSITIWRTSRAPRPTS